MTRVQANGLLLLVALIWGSAFVPQSLGMSGVGPYTFTGVRFLLGALIVAPLAWRDWRRLRFAPASPGPRLLGREIGLLGLLLTTGAVMQQVGIVSTSVTNAGFLTALYVPLVPLLAWLAWRQRPHWTVWPGALGCVVGSWLLSGANAVEIRAGDLWIIASALPWALHVLAVGRASERLPAPFLLACGQFVICGLVGLALGLATEPQSWSGLREAAWAIAYTGVLSVGIGYTGQVVGQRHARAADAAIILSAETVFAALGGALVMGERLSPAGLAGCALILACILLVQLMPLWHWHAARRRAEGDAIIVR